MKPNLLGKLTSAKLSYSFNFNQRFASWIIFFQIFIIIWEFNFVITLRKNLHSMISYENSFRRSVFVEKISKRANTMNHWLPWLSCFEFNPYIPYKIFIAQAILSSLLLEFCCLIYFIQSSYFREFYGAWYSRWLVLQYFRML